MINSPKCNESMLCSSMTAKLRLHNCWETIRAYLTHIRMLVFDHQMIICGSALRIHGLDWLGVFWNLGGAFPRKLEYRAAGTGSCSSNSGNKQLMNCSFELLGLAVALPKTKRTKNNETKRQKELTDCFLFELLGLTLALETAPQPNDGLLL